MNRKKKIFTILKKRAKKANAKNVHSSKPKYISKADREQQALEAAQAEQTDTAKLIEE